MIPDKIKSFEDILSLTEKKLIFTSKSVSDTAARKFIKLYKREKTWYFKLLRVFHKLLFKKSFEIYEKEKNSKKVLTITQALNKGWAPNWCNSSTNYLKDL